MRSNQADGDTEVPKVRVIETKGKLLKQKKKIPTRQRNSEEQSAIRTSSIDS